MPTSPHFRTDNDTTHDANLTIAAAKCRTFGQKLIPVADKLWSRGQSLWEWAVPSLMGLADLHVRREAESAAPLLAEAERLAQEGSLGYRLPEIHLTPAMEGTRDCD